MNRDIVFYNYMTPEQQDLLNRSMQQASFRKGQIVHRHGDSCVGLIFVRKGRLAFSILSEEGREITVFRVEKGEVCILSAACILRSLEFESQITAEVNTEVSILPAPTLSQLMNANHDVERLVYKQAVWQYSASCGPSSRSSSSAWKSAWRRFCWTNVAAVRPSPFPRPTSRSPATSAPPARWSPGCSTSLPTGGL